MHASIILCSVSTVLAIIQADCLGWRPESAPAVNVSNVTQGRPKSPHPQEVLTKVRGIVAEVLSLKPEEVDVDAPLVKQKNAADELDVVEIVLTVEEAYDIEIKDEELGGTLEEVTTKLTVRRLADIVNRRKSVKK